MTSPDPGLPGSGLKLRGPQEALERLCAEDHDTSFYAGDDGCGVLEGLAESGHDQRIPDALNDSGRLVLDQAAPLLASNGHPSGLYFHRFTRPGVTEVVQAWDDRRAVYARLSDASGKTAPLAGPSLLYQSVGAFAEVVEESARARLAPTR
ncbi:hypothetical protein GCM10009660_17970 [Catellatospora bangladeshensis]